MTSPAARLLDWYDRHHRVLPWRVDPPARARGERPEPYRVWLSEIMLQQTTVQAVRPYFADFLARWPHVEALAAAEEAEVLKAWAGLGYYSRARNLKKCADRIVAEHGGRFPRSAAALAALPGIGSYTAAAVAAIAFDEAVPVVDGNVERVVSRLAAIDTPLPKAKAAIRAAVARLTPAARPGDFAQAMMDLGATICTPRRPSCMMCPLRSDCAARASDDPERFPVKAAKKDKPARRGAAFVAVDPQGAVYLTRRGGSGLLAGMSQVPTTGWSAGADGETGREAAPFAADWQAAGAIAHTFTHFALSLTVYRAHLGRRPPTAAGWWSPPEALAGEALPTVMRKVIAAALPDAFPPRRGRR